MIRWLLAFSILLTGCKLNDHREIFDVVILNGQVYDGVTNTFQELDLGISNGVIATTSPRGELPQFSTNLTIDASGKVVSPGFIDLHSHNEKGILKAPEALNILYQGVTTILAGNCGSSPLNLNEYFNQWSQQGSSLNVGMLIGHNTVRRHVMNRENRHATESELRAMKQLVSKAMKEGAFGLSTGLLYIPGAFAPPQELFELASSIKPFDGFYATHLRSESELVLEALNEALEVAKQAQVPVHISHHKTSGPSAWGKSVQSINLIAQARSQGFDITLDLYPYTASNTNLGVLLPQWSLEGGRSAFRERMKQKDLFNKVLKESADIIKNQRAGDELDRIVVSQYNADKSWVGMSFAEILLKKGKALTAQNAAELAIEIELNGGGRGIYHTMLNEDVERIMQFPHASIASDGRGIVWQQGKPHPRNYGSYPRVIAHYVNHKNTLNLADAIYKMTALPAKRMQLKDRGLIKTGYKADIIVWDKNELKDLSTFEDPHKYSQGIDYMLVNGVMVIADSTYTGEKPGHALRNM